MIKTCIHLVLAVCIAGPLYCAQPTRISAFFRSGQTFITWCEDIGQAGEKYRIYRHSSPITTGNLSSATLVTEIKEGSSYFREMHNCDSALTETLQCYIDRYIIQPVSSGIGTQLSDTTGLFVFTVQDIGQIQSYYAVTTVSAGGAEETGVSAGNSAGPVTEQKQHPDAVRYFVDDVKDYYILWFDHEIYHGYEGNAAPLAITRSAFTQGGNMPSMHLDGIGTHFPGANYTNYGNTDYGGGNGMATWYFGHHMSNQYNGGCGNNGWNISDTVANYVQYKHMQAVLWARRHFNITSPKFHINGNSMGASGAYGFLMNFPSFVTSVFTNEGLTQYRVPGYSPQNGLMWQSTIWANYGDTALNNPVKFLPFNDPDYPDLDWVTQYSGMGIYDARDAVKFLKSNTQKSFGYLTGGHCFSDGSIQFAYNGAPFEEYIKDSRHCFSYIAREGSHSWQSAMPGNGRMSSYIRWDESRPGFSNVDGIEGCQYGAQLAGSRSYMCFVEWGCADHAVMGNKRLAETETSWKLPIISVSTCDTRNIIDLIDITPRNLQRLKVCEGDTFTYTIKDSLETTVQATGDIVADSLQLLLIPGVPIRLSGCVAQINLKARGNNYPCSDMDPPMHAVLNGPVKEHDAKIIAMPNPFNPVVTISLRAPYAAHANVTIFSISGRLITDLKLINGTAVWNAAGMPSGVYIVEALAGSKHLSRKIVLAK